MQFLILGPLEVRSEGGVVAVRGQRQRALLASLLLRANEVVSVDALADGLWGESPPRTAAHSLQVFVSDLRKALRAAGEDGRIVTQPPGYRIEVRPGELDLGRFERRAAEGRAALARGEAAVATQTLREALAVWRGDPLADVAYEPFAQEAVARLEEQRLSVLEDRLTADLQLGKHAELVGELEALVAQHPFREGFRAQLMLALYRAGRQSEALAVYQATRTLLVEALGIDPKPELQELERAILVQDPSLEPPFPRQTAAVQRERARLPTPPTRLVGRKRELAELEELVAAQRLVTVTGPGGMGKTRIALAACERLQASFENGARFVQLAALTDPGLLPASLVLALELEERPGEELADTIAHALQDRELLLCLDNMEQLRAAGSFLAELLTRCPRLRLLATSRSGLRLAGEHEYPLPPLEDDEALQLFGDRARAVVPGFALQEHEQTAKAICERLDRLPLALELAAARLKLFSPAALLERLDRSLRLLTGGARDLPERQQTLHAAINWSYQLLDAEEQRLFRSLSVFAGGFTLKAASAVTQQDELELLERLSALVEHNLVRRLADGDEPRFTLLNLLREYAGERLEESPDADQTHRRHGVWCLDFAGEIDARSGGAAAAWLARIDSHHDDYRAALAWARDAGDQQLLCDLALALSVFWQMRGHLSEALAWFEHVLARTDDLLPERLAQALDAASNIAYRAGEYDQVVLLGEEQLRISRELQDTRGTVVALAKLAGIAGDRGDFDRSRVLHEEALAAARRDGDQRSVFNALTQLGNLELTVGEYGRAAEVFEECVPLCRSHHLAGALFNLGLAKLLAGAPGDAAEPLRESVRLSHELRDPEDLGYALEAIAALALMRGRDREAAMLLGAAATLLETAGATLEPVERALHDRTEAQARAALDEGFDAAWEEGRALPFDEVAAMAAGAAA